MFIANVGFTSVRFSGDQGDPNTRNDMHMFEVMYAATSIAASAVRSWQETDIQLLGALRGTAAGADHRGATRHTVS